jgi:hypothetical protein
MPYFKKDASGLKYKSLTLWGRERGWRKELLVL